MAGERAKAHARRGYFCSCGAIVHGNGGKHNHREMHRRVQDGHRYVTSEQYRRIFPSYIGGPSKRRVPGPRDLQTERTNHAH